MHFGAGEMAQQLRTLAVLTENLDLDLSILIVVHNSNCSHWGSNTLFWLLPAPGECDAHIYRQTRKL